MFGGPDDNDGNGSFGALVLRHRRTAELTQEELAAAAQLSVRAISDIERGRARGPQQRSVEALADALRLAGQDREGFVDTARRGRRRSPRRPEPWFPPPADGCDLVGRDTELACLRRLAEQAISAELPAGAMAAISGLPGVGKSSLAGVAAGRLGALFPDGMLHLDLHGVDEPLDPDHGLGRLLRLLGVPDAELPSTYDERVARYRSLVRHRRVLVVLDDAASEAQVRPLLPGAPGSLTLVTSRQALAGLDAAHRMVLDVLEPDHAVALLTRVVGAPRVAAEQQAAREIAALCGYLPLALRVASNRLASRPEWTVRHLAGRLSDQQRRLSMLTAGDVQVRAAFELSYRQLDQRTREAFRRLALVPGPDFTVPLAAVLGEVDESHAEQTVELLVDASLLHPAAGGGRYRFHALTRAFAGERLAEEELAAEREAAAARLNGWMLRTASRAGQLLDARRPAAADDSEPVPFRTATEAEAWLEAELGSWIPAIRDVTSLRRPEDIAAIARALCWYANAGTPPMDVHQAFEYALSTCRTIAYGHDDAVLLTFLGWTLYYRLGRPWLRASTPAVERRRGWDEAWVDFHTAGLMINMGDPDGAVDHSHRAIAGFRETDCELGVAVARGGLAAALAAQGRAEQALDVQRANLAYYRGAGAGPDAVLGATGSAFTLMCIGQLQAELGLWSEALNAYTDAADLLNGVGNHWAEGRARLGQGLAHRRLGRPETAHDCLWRANALLVAVDDRYSQARVLNELALACDELRDPAADEHRQRASWLGNQLDPPSATHLRGMTPAW
ncbi:ATP-binding protein [Actinocrispum wychmicini]|uniref:Putative ATPase n=1 Tax=Actinocrispum wychmicini TaxID=1213861 RepID=A0A4R2JC76_9PSEU|nr:XRE family transcriptional regulator [Actinocrispum wychmicini]TCO56027.1 putative ATPase [Actinocrispum wychmicini]